MADDMEGIDVQDRSENPEQKALSLWIAGSKADVDQWMSAGRIPITEWAPQHKGSYVGFRDSSGRAAERHQQRCLKEGKSFAKEDILVLEVHLDKEVYARMGTEKLKVPGRGWVTRLHYETYLDSSEGAEDWGVWYYFGGPFNLWVSGVNLSCATIY